jgi:hypothetical protein
MFLFCRYLFYKFILELFDVFGDTKVNYVREMFFDACKAIE